MGRAWRVVSSLRRLSISWREAIWAAIRADWRERRYYLPFGALVALLTTLVVVAYYALMPGSQSDPDTIAYLNAARHIAFYGQFVDPARLPGYPLFIALVFTLAGWDNMQALGIAQGVVFVLATLLCYALVTLVTQRAWLAALVSLLVGSNTRILSYAKAPLTEGLALFFTVVLALAMLLFLRQPGARSVWLTLAVAFALCMVRPEWVYCAPVVALLLLLMAWRRGCARRLLPHALAATLVFYSLIGVYVARNDARYSVASLTYVQNINLLGKVIQYHMQDEAPPEYAPVTQVIDDYEARGVTDPWTMLGGYKPLRDNGSALAGRYALAIIERRPVEFLARSAPVVVYSLGIAYPYRPLSADAPGWLKQLDVFSDATLRQMNWFLLLAPLWWLLWLAQVVSPRARRIAQQLPVEAIGALALLAAYDLALTTLGGYIYYPRLHAPFDPLLIVVVYGGTLIAAVAGADALYTRYHRSWRLRHPKSEVGAI